MARGPAHDGDSSQGNSSRSPPADAWHLLASFGIIWHIRTRCEDQRKGRLMLYDMYDVN